MIVNIRILILKLKFKKLPQIILKIKVDLHIVLQLSCFVGHPVSISYLVGSIMNIADSRGYKQTLENLH